MKHTFLFLILLASFLLASCSRPSDAPGAQSSSGGKTPFEVRVQKISDTNSISTIEKTGRITTNSNLTLSPQGAGEVAKINVKEGQKVKAGSVLISLRDTTNNYDLRLSQAENALKTQEATITTTTINLNQGIENAKIGYERAKQALETLKGKNALVYDTAVVGNTKTLDAYNESYKTFTSDLERLMTQSLYDADKILGITTTYEYANDSFESFLGNRAGNSYSLAKDAWNTTYAYRGKMRAKKESGTGLNAADIETDIKLITDGYKNMQAFADAMLFMLQNNTIGSWLSQVMQDGWIASWNAFKAQVQAGEAQFNTWKSQTQTFFKNYKNTERATQLALESLTRPLTSAEESELWTSADMRLTYENTRLDLSDRIKNAELSVKQAKIGLDSAISIKEATLTQLDTSRNTLEINLEQARRDSAKLTVTAPVDGTIAKVLANIGQTASPWTPMIEFAGNTPQILIDIEPTLADGLFIGDPVTVVSEGKSFSGTIGAISRVTSANLLIPVRILVSRAESMIGKNATLRFEKTSPLASKSIILPIDAVKIIAEWEGEIAVLSGSTDYTRVRVQLGRSTDQNIEIIGDIDPNASIILSSLENFDSMKNTLSVRP